MADLQVETTLEPFGPAGAILLTDEQVQTLGGGKRAAVVVSVGGHSARLRLAVMGGKNCIGMSTAVRADLGLAIGDPVSARIALDGAPREVEVPAELAAALATDPAVAAAYERLAYTHRKEYATWVAEAKKQPTRDRRAAQAVEMLREGRPRS